MIRELPGKGVCDVLCQKCTNDRVENRPAPLALFEGTVSKYAPATMKWIAQSAIFQQHPRPAYSTLLGDNQKACHQTVYAYLHALRKLLIRCFHCRFSLVPCTIIVSAPSLRIRARRTAR